MTTAVVFVFVVKMLQLRIVQNRLYFCVYVCGFNSTKEKKQQTQQHQHNTNSSEEKKKKRRKRLIHIVAM